MANTLPITRQNTAHGFIYRDYRGQKCSKEKCEWIHSIAIPPAWSNVRIANSKRAKVYALGYDAAGREQRIYNPAFRAKQERLKFDHILQFAQQLPKLRQRVEHDLRRTRLSREKVLACIVKLIDEAYFRVGNERYANENHSYGITTLRHRHLDVSGDTVTFDFIGKSGQHHVKQITDRQLARIIRQLDEMPGYEIFRYRDEKGTMHDISNPDVNSYIKSAMGQEFTAKDFRTWGGTLLATIELVTCERSDSLSDRRKTVTQIVKHVAKRLGNTPAIARKSYIDPRIINIFIDTTKVLSVKNAMNKMHPRKYMSRDEQYLLRLLQS